MDKNKIMVGSQIRTLKSLKPWAPLHFEKIPAGAQGRVIGRHIDVHPTITGTLKIRWAVVDFRWVDQKGKAKSGRWPVNEDNLKDYKVIQPKKSLVVADRTSRLVSKPPRITPKTPRLR